ncbi:Uncharacterized protein SCF082_LOCUS49604, partial [Durusdinium trenchii]
AELEDTKLKLGEVVDEVLFLESELSAARRQNDFLCTALADNTAAHAQVIQLLNLENRLLKYRLHNEPDSTTAHLQKLGSKADAAVTVALDDLRTFQQTLQRSLVDSKLKLPSPTFLESPGPLREDEKRELLNLGQPGGDDNVGTPLDSNFGLLNRPSSSGSEARIRSGRPKTPQDQAKRLQELEQECAEWENKAARLEREVQLLRDDLDRAKAHQVWPFRDDHRSADGAFGMSSNTNVMRKDGGPSDEERQVAIPRPRQNGTGLLADYKAAASSSRDNSAATTDSAADEIARLKRMIQDSDRQHEDQRKALMRETERELRDAESQIAELTRQLKRARAAPTNPTAAASPSSSPSRAAAKFRVRRMQIHESGDVELEGAGELVPHGMLQAAESAASRRVSELEGQLARERLENDKLRRERTAAVREKSEALGRFEDLELEHGIGQQEFETERSQRAALREELEKAQRDKEATSRELRASERRHQALMQDLKEVMEERDRAFGSTESANRQYLEAVQALEMVRTEVEGLTSERDQAVREQERLLKEKQHVQRNLDAERRNRESLGQDIAILQQQKQTIQMERDAALQEQLNALKRLDDASADRKAALMARDKALAEKKDMDDEMAQLRVADHRHQLKARELQGRIDALDQQLAEATTKLKAAEQAAAQAGADLAELKEAKVDAEQEMEVAQRQCRAIGEELKSVLRVRDIALQQRDAALQRLREGEGKLEDHLALTSSRVSPRNGAAPEHPNSIYDRMDQLEVALATVEEEKKDLESALRASGNLGETKDSLVGLSTRLLDIHEIFRAAYDSMSEALEDAGSGAPRGATAAPAAPASPSHSLGEVVQMLLKQVETLELDGSRQTRCVSKFAETCRRLTQLSQRLSAGQGDHGEGEPGEQGIAGVREQQLQVMHQRLEKEQERNLELQREVQEKISEARFLSNRIEETRTKLERAEERIAKLETQKAASLDQDVAGGATDVAKDWRKRVEDLEASLDGAKREHQAEEERLHNEIEEERLQLREALERLKASDDKALELQRKLRAHTYELERLQGERDKLASHVETASSQLKGVAHQKTSAAKELEEVYASLTDLETQLLASHAENRRLKKVVAQFSGKERGAQNGVSAAAEHGGDVNEVVEDAQTSRVAVGGSQRNIRIKRSGSIVID